VTGGKRRSRHVRPGAAGASMPRGPAARAQPGACPGSSRGCLVGRRRAGFGAGRHLCPLEDRGQGVPAARGLWGASRSSPTLRSQESQDTARVQGGASRVSHAGPDRAAASAGSEGLAYMGSAAGARLSACLSSCRRPQRRSGALTSQAAGAPAAAGHGVDRRASRRLPCRRGHDTRLAVCQTSVSRPL
jgi:hypothetical protein